MWWVAAELAQEQPQEPLFAWRRDEESGRIESIWVEPDGDVHRVDGFVTVVDGVVWKWVSLPYTTIGSRCDYLSDDGSPASDLELYPSTRDVLLPFGLTYRIDLTTFTDDLDGSGGSSAVPFAQLGPWLFVERSITREPCGSSGAFRWDLQTEGPVYDLRSASTVRVEAWVDPGEAVRAEARVRLFLEGRELAAHGKPPEPARWIPTWDGRGRVRIELVMATGKPDWVPNEWLGRREAVLLPRDVPDALVAWSAPSEPIASFLAGHRGGWCASAVYEERDDAFLRGTFDVPAADAFAR